MKKENTSQKDLLTVIEIFEKSNIKYWLDGGWGVDVLSGKQTRVHRDIDINYDANEKEKLLKILFEYGYQIETDCGDIRMELYSQELGYLDIHPFHLDDDGGAKQANPEGGWFEFPACFFGTALFADKNISCISLEGQLLFHTGYELREKDKHDIAILKQLPKHDI